jgi:hypothetical protein
LRRELRDWNTRRTTARAALPYGGAHEVLAVRNDRSESTPPWGRRAPRLDAPDGSVLTTASVNATAGNNSFASTSVPITDPGGTHKFYLVFQTDPDGPASGFGNLDRVEFVARASGLCRSASKRWWSAPRARPTTAQIA